MGELADATFGTLSGGQRQRVLIARALVQEAGLLLLDEPFSGLDSRAADRLLALIDELAAVGRTILIATHDLDQARAWDLVLCLNRRQVAFGHPSETLTREVLEATYGGAIVEIPGEGGGLGVLPPTTTTTSTRTMPDLASIGSFLADPLSDPLVRRAAIEVALIGIVGGALGCWIVHYGLPYAAESVAHCMLPGLVLASLAGAPADPRRRGRACLRESPRSRSPPRAPGIGRETAVAVAVTTLFGLGALLALSPETPPNLQGILFGDVLAVSGERPGDRRGRWSR